MCEYCEKNKKGIIMGKTISTSEFQKTAGYVEKEGNSLLEIWILKNKEDEKAGLMINTTGGIRFVDIDYCPFCGEKII